jgi:peptidoglycan/LPS O-acetylase OafA/YrhL
MKDNNLQQGDAVLSLPSAELKQTMATSNYPFVDWIRMIAMVGIIWAHTPNFDGANNYNSLDNIPLYFWFMGFFKFGVICFFLISGFLLARKIHEAPAAEYLKKRVLSTLYPYLFAFALIVLLFIFKTQALGQPSSYTVPQYVIFMFLSSALWFLPNYWISLLVIVSFRRFLNSIWLGILFLTVTLIYSYFYVYTTAAQSHVHALFAFVFYLWLGYFIGTNSLHIYFSSINPWLLIGLSFFCYGLSSVESVVLYQQGAKEPMNILRISNQLYSLLAFATMVRLFKHPFKSKWFAPRKETFGIYLYHMFALAVLTFALKFFAGKGIFTYSNHTITFIGWFVVKFLFVYVFTLLLVKLMLRFNLGFLNQKSN